MEKISKEEQWESEELNNVLYMLHTTPIMDKIGIANISNATKEDLILNEL